MDQDDEDALHAFLRNDAIVGSMQARCHEYLDERTYRKQIRTDSGGYADALELYVPVGSCTIQKIIDDQAKFDTVRLQSPAPDLLPIKLIKISDDPGSYIIPSETLTIDAILPRSPRYHLQAILCEINQHDVVFVKHLPTRKWYYCQKDYPCEQFSDGLNANLNRILDSRPSNEQQHLIKSTHFLVSMLFHHPIKYVYKRDDQYV
jgi:hypothetical protein